MVMPFFGKLVIFARLITSLKYTSLVIDMSTQPMLAWKSCTHSMCSYPIDVSRFSKKSAETLQKFGAVFGGITKGKNRPIVV